MIKCSVPKVVTTRWGTYVNVCNFYIDRLEIVIKFIDFLIYKTQPSLLKKPDTTPNENVKNYLELKKLIKSENFKEQMTLVSSLCEITTIMTKLQTRGLSLADQINYVDCVGLEIQNLLDMSKNGKKINDTKFYTELIDKYNQVVDKNSGYKKLRYCLSKGTLPKQLNFAQINSSEIERTFNILHIMVNDRRTNLSDENVEQC